MESGLHGTEPQWVPGALPPPLPEADAVLVLEHTFLCSPGLLELVVVSDLTEPKRPDKGVHFILLLF